MSTSRRRLHRARHDQRLALLLIGQLLGCSAISTAAPRLVGDRFVNDADQPVLAAWAAGLQDPGQLDGYLAAGFSLVYLSLPSDQPCKELARAAAERGLGVVLALQPIRATVDGRLAMDDPAAVRETARWLAEAVVEWQDTPGLVAWAVQDEVEAAVDWSRSATRSICPGSMRANPPD